MLHRREVLTFAIVSSLVLGTPSILRAEKGPVILDERWVAPDFAQRCPHHIAVLPAVTFDGYPQDHLVSDLLFNASREDGRDWLMPSLARLRFGADAHERDSTLRAIALAVRHDGHTDALSTTALARRLRADALVFVRIDRWEHTSTPSEQTSIDARIELVDSTGSPLLRIVARSRIYGGTAPSDADAARQAPGDRSTVKTLTPPSPTTSGGTSVVASSSIVQGSGGAGSTVSARQSGQLQVVQNNANRTPAHDGASDLVITTDEDLPFVAAATALVRVFCAALPPPPASTTSPAVAPPSR